MLPDSEGSELGCSNKEAPPSAGKNAGIVLIPCSCMEVHSIPTAISEVPGCLLLRQMSSQSGSQKLL